MLMSSSPAYWVGYIQSHEDGTLAIPTRTPESFAKRLASSRFCVLCCRAQQLEKRRGIMNCMPTRAMPWYN